MSLPDEILYVDMWSGEPVHERKLLGMRRYAAMRGWRIVPVGDCDSRPKRLRTALASPRALGCIVECSAGHRDLPPSVFGRVPVVYLDCAERLYGGRISKVIHDGKATTREAFLELSSNQPGAYAVVGHEAGYFWSKLRVKAFREMVRSAGSACHVFAPRGGDSRKDALARWIARLPNRCAVFAVNDDVAREVVGASRDAGRRIPAEITLVGVDNQVFCSSPELMISSIQIDFERAGYRAVKMLDDLVSGRRPYLETFGPLMVVRRRSTRGYGHDEPRLAAAIDIIRAKACDGLRARDVIALFGGSRRLIDLRFREMFGHSILDEIMTVRFEKVFFLLAHTRVSLSAIASQCGFGSEVTLRQLFRRRTGMSMSDWRKRNTV